MNKRTEVGSRKQERKTSVALSTVMQQLVLPMMVGVEATRDGLLSFVHQMGLRALDELLGIEAESIAGPKGRKLPSRTHHHWGTARTPLPFGGRTLKIERPRVRRKSGGEEVLPSLQAFCAADPMSERVVEQIVLGVSTRGYERSLEPVPADAEVAGTSKSSASRALIDGTAQKLAEFLDRKLDDVDLIAMFIDGLEIADKTTVVALGVTRDGTKIPLGIWLGSTENTALTTSLVQNLLERGLCVTEKTLFVIDGGKGIRRALQDVFGDNAVVQRCQVHKTRNVRDHLPEERRGYVTKQMNEAYRSTNAKVAKKRLLQLANWLESNDEDGAAASLREGLDETLTVLRLDLPAALRRTFATTNAIENMNGTIRRVCRNVKRWRDEGMIRRWVALGIGEARSKFRRVKGFKFMPALVAALRPTTTSLESESKVA